MHTFNSCNDPISWYSQFRSRNTEFQSHVLADAQLELANWLVHRSPGISEKL